MPAPMNVVAALKNSAPLRHTFHPVIGPLGGFFRRPRKRVLVHPEILQQGRAAGAEVAYVTLHVGLGTFQPLHMWQEQGRLHAERYRVTEDNAAKMRAACSPISICRKRASCCW
ncbi:hypothetical protein SBA3_4290005 [Candidatus Sulfopaludibacter sp. SbA3]|nr:hypothetical protein SBA3_4290005 [Candidatus Sulfopaludibacter sp. SbA3]